ncbi:DgyrCDS14193 [Dimorphilus gyrociliatus]|uniref:DgyrCDS14193 n=1 Tax=Dimorphilus gyrociliatus TaxID=2664684 RepID=A0A7I8WCY2_9ANNE|nr:DgyrCDS14193 [Dimorphilus gyrociliatus]
MPPKKLKSYWGKSPAIDFLSYPSNIHTVDDKRSILMIGANDIRHILKTVSQRFKYENSPKINFYVLEEEASLYARFILLLCIATEKTKRFGLQQKAEFLLEIWGNSFIRVETLEYVQKMSQYIKKFVGDVSGLKSSIPFLDNSQLTMRERDEIYDEFHSWSKPVTGKEFDIRNSWDERLRSLLGVRYDSKTGVFDWDYQMRLAQRGRASIITSHKYNRWRLDGMAYSLRNADYNQPNVTLCTKIPFERNKVFQEMKVYLGDIVHSPFVSFGMECDDKELYKTANNVHINNGEDIAKYNALSMLYSIEHGKAFDKSITEEDNTKIMEVIEEDEEEANELLASSPWEMPFEPLSLDGITVSFLPCKAIKDLHKKRKYEHFFDDVFVNKDFLKDITEDFCKTLKPSANLTVDTAKYDASKTNENVSEIYDKLIDNIKILNFEVSLNDKDTDFIRAVFKDR